jgi:polysaccharide biosynthesis transport protein
MAISQVTPRDRVQHLADLGRKTLRYWWLVAVFAVVGGALSLTFAMLRAKKYQSWATLFYQERIQTSLLSPSREEVAQRNIGDKYRELLLARAQLEKIVTDPEVNPFPKEKDKDVAIDKLRQLVKLEVRGGNVFRIVYTDADPDRAKAVTERLTKMLQEKDDALRNEQAKATVDFATTQKKEAQKELRLAEQQLAEFLAKHPEFAQDASQANAEGASIRAIKKNTVPTGGNTKLYSLERQKQRIQAALDAPADAPVKITAPPSAEKLAAERAVDAAEAEVNAAKRALEDASAKYTPKHPTVIGAQERLTAAQQRLRQAQAAVPPDVMISPATPEKREKMKQELADVERQIQALQNKKEGSAATPSVDASTNWIVKLETEYAELRRVTGEQRERVESLDASVFRAQIDASQKAAEAGGRLASLDPAFKPVKPSGPGKTIFLMAGMLLFVTLGLALAIGLAVIDDRLYRRADLDHLGVAVLAVIPTATARQSRNEKKRKR